MEPGAGPNRGGMLDAPPPQPPGQARRATLMDMQSQSQSPNGGLGAEAANPQIVALQGLAMMQKGSDLITSAIPQFAPALSGLMSNLRQVLPQAMSDQLAGIDPASGAAGMAGGGGVPAPTAPPTGAAGAPVNA